MDVTTCKRHKRIAESARERLSSLKIKSNNKFWQNTTQVDNNLGKQRSAFGYGGDKSGLTGIGHGTWAALEDDEFVADMTYTLRAGNCDEKASVYGVLASRDRQITGSHIYRCAFSPYDHVIAIMSTVGNLNPGGNNVNFSAFGDDAIVLDGWAEDWWFPNLSNSTVLRYNLWRFGDPFALKVHVSSQMCNNLDIKSKIC